MDYNLKKSIFLHIPKTGGSWVKKVLSEATDLVMQRGGNWHEIPKGFNDKFWFCFIRHPETWYQSYWCFNIKENKWKNGPCGILSKFKHDEFNGFVDQVSKAYPKGFLSSYLYPKYIRESDFVGRYENMVEDLIAALKMAEEEFDPEKIRQMSTYHRNVGSKLPEFIGRCDYHPNIKLAMLKSEQDVINKYYAD